MHGSKNFAGFGKVSRLCKDLVKKLCFLQKPLPFSMTLHAIQLLNILLPRVPVGR